MNFLISDAYAAADAAGAAAPGGSVVMTNIMMILVFVLLFYMLLIRPQQKRFKQHTVMIEALKKGDKVVTAGGLIGKVDKLPKDSDEIVIDLGGGNKVTAVRSTVQIRNEATLTASVQAKSK